MQSPAVCASEGMGRFPAELSTNGSDVNKREIRDSAIITTAKTGSSAVTLPAVHSRKGLERGVVLRYWRPGKRQIQIS